jgi:hypothetical protein
MPNQFTRRAVFYVYVLFDWRGVPRWVGKGKNNRWLNHERSTDTSNWLKNEFIEQTWAVLGDIPKIRVRENLAEADAFAIEIALIAAIGRLDQNKGPLLNLTDGGEGMVGQPKFYGLALAARNAAVSRGHRRRTPEQIRASSALRAANYPKGFWREKALKQFARMTQEERSRWARTGGLAAGAMWWINNGEKSRRIKPNSQVPEGWIRGRLYMPPAKFRNYAAETTWINNGTSTRRISNNEPIPYGWELGRGVRRKPSTS